MGARVAAAQVRALGGLTNGTNDEEAAAVTCHSAPASLAAVLQ